MLHATIQFQTTFSHACKFLHILLHDFKDGSILKAFVHLLNTDSCSLIFRTYFSKPLHAYGARCRMLGWERPTSNGTWREFVLESIEQSVIIVTLDQCCEWDAGRNEMSVVIDEGFWSFVPCVRFEDVSKNKNTCQVMLSERETHRRTLCSKDKPYENSYTCKNACQGHFTFKMWNVRLTKLGRHYSIQDQSAGSISR